MKALLRSTIIGLILFGGMAAFSSAATSSAIPGAPCPRPQLPTIGTAR